MLESPTCGEDPPEAATGATVPEVRLTVEGVHLFVPPPPLEPGPIVQEASRGLRTETDVLRRAASEFSSAFVFRLPDIVRGRARREPGDGLILVGSRLLVLQVKARDTQGPDSEDRARAWTNKQSAKALSQLRGTMRVLGSASGPLNLEPVDPPEGIEKVRLVVDSSELSNMAGVLVIEHPDQVAEVDVLPEIQGVPVVRMRLEEWDYIVTTCGSATELLKYVFDLANPAADYGTQRNDFARTALGKARQPFPVPDPPGLPTAPGTLHLGTFQVPMDALLNKRELALDAEFRNAIFGCLMNETRMPDGLSHSRVRRGLAAVDRLPRKERRRAVEHLIGMLAHGAGGDELRRFIASAGPTEQLVQVVCPTISAQAPDQAWRWVEETHADQEGSHGEVLTVGIVWVPTSGVWRGRARLYGG